MRLIGYVAALVGAIVLSSPVTATVRKVDCDKGQTITQAIRVANTGDTIRVEGVCTERVIVTKDRLTIDGRGEATIDGGGLDPPAGVHDGGLITVDTARDVTIRGFLVRNSPGGAGVVATRSSSVLVSECTIQDTDFTGVFIYENTSIELDNVAIRRAGSQGIAVSGSSFLILKGDIVSNENGVDGLDAWGESSVDLLGANLEVSNNGRAGLFGFDAAFHTAPVLGTGPNTIVAKGNGLAGIGIVGKAQLVFSVPASVVLSENKGFGLWVVAGSIANPLGRASFSVTDNPVGIHIENQGTFTFVTGSLAVEGNPTGLEADNSSVTIIGGPETHSISGDVKLSFGTRATLRGVDVEALPIICDDTVLSRGTVTCP